MLEDFISVIPLSYETINSEYRERTRRITKRRKSDWPRGRSSSPGRVKIFILSTSSRPNLGPTQPPIQWVLGGFPKAARV
jgi:hypothetical protein